MPWAAHRLKDKKAFNNLFRFGKTFSCGALVMKAGLSEKNRPTQFGFAVGLKFSKKAVERNKFKRWMREAVRPKVKDIKPGWHIVFLPSAKFPKKELRLELIRENVENLLKKAKIL